jgi:hypothetical protein
MIIAHGQCSSHCLINIIQSQAIQACGYSQRIVEFVFERPSKSFCYASVNDFNILAQGLDAWGPNKAGNPALK